MEELFDTIAWETASSNPQPTDEPLWARVCAYAGGFLLVVVGAFFMALGTMIGVR